MHYCIIPKEALVFKHLSSTLYQVLECVVNVVNFSLKARLFNILYEDVATEHLFLLYYNSVLLTLYW